MSLGHRTKKYTSPTYYSWTAMKNRCPSETSKDWPRYGGRGITVCPRWLEFPNFLADMGEKPGPGWSIERGDVNGNYEPGNCRWASPKTQANNRTNTRALTLNGKTQSMGAWAAEAGISRGRLKYRLDVIGMDLETALMKDTLPNSGYLKSQS